MTTFIEFNNVSVNLEIFDHKALRLFRKNISNPLSDKITKTKESGHVFVEALKNISFNYTTGDCIGLIGKNGSGKSTLLKVIASIIDINSGGIVTNANKIELLDTGSYLKEELSGYECIEYFANLNQLDKIEHKKITEDIENLSGLGDFLFLPIKSYSAGMKTRLSSILVTSLNSEIICIDEGIGSVDIEYQQLINNRLREKIQKSGLTFIASHDFSLLRNFCNKGIVLSNGVVLLNSSINECCNFYMELQ